MCDVVCEQLCFQKHSFCKKKKKMESVNGFLAGWFAGLGVAVVFSPFDRVKVEMQNKHFIGGTFRCARALYARNGIGEFYKGLSSPILGSVVARGALFGVQLYATNVVTEMKRNQTGKSDVQLSTGEIIFCYTCGGVANSFCLTPFELVRIRLQTQFHSNRLYEGPMHCAKRIYTRGGMCKMFLGLTAALMRDIPGTVVYFGTYEWLQRQMGEEAYARRSQMRHVLFAGGIAGFAREVVIFPFDTVKTKWQVARRREYYNIVHVFRCIHREEGFMGFYRGMGPALVRAFFSNAVCFMGVETTLRVLYSLGGGEQ